MITLTETCTPLRIARVDVHGFALLDLFVETLNGFVHHTPACTHHASSNDCMNRLTRVHIHTRIPIVPCVQTIARAHRHIYMDTHIHTPILIALIRFIYTIYTSSKANASNRCVSTRVIASGYHISRVKSSTLR